MRIGILLHQFLADEAVSVEPLMRAEVLRQRIELPAAFVDRFARTRSIGVNVLARQRLNTNFIKDFRVVLDNHGLALDNRLPMLFPALISAKKAQKANQLSN